MITETSSVSAGMYASHLNSIFSSDGRKVSSNMVEVFQLLTGPQFA